jgi:16S rRNA (adenine1518-N6/adenine1519-N6)-dimethyltransferase
LPELKELIKPKKSLGQNFLVDPSVAERIVKAVSPSASDLIIEIGPGTGALTRLLAENAGHVIAIELDSRLIEALRTSHDPKKLTLIEQDALAVDWNQLAMKARVFGQQARPGPENARRLRIVANLPYYISTAIIERLLTVRTEIHDLTLMLQKEVVDRITSPPGSRDYGYLSVLVQYHAVASKLFDVAPEAFNPPPKVTSSVVRLTVRSEAPVAVDDEEKFFALVRAAFAQRRKTLQNNLKVVPARAFPRGPREALMKAGIEGGRRAETLSLDEFARLYGALYCE